MARQKSISIVLAFLALASFAATHSASAQGEPIRDLQYSTYLKTNDFDAGRVAQACRADESPGIRFKSSADEKNIALFLEFLQTRPDDIQSFNNGQFSQTAAAIGDAVVDVCQTIADYSEENDADEIFSPLTSFDPLIDDINLSSFEFEYRFRHDQPQGHLPLARRTFPVLELNVDYRDNNFPDQSGNLWTHSTAVLEITINNYDYFRYPESGRVGAIRQENDSYPCYYTDPNFTGVYRYAFEDCNPDTLVDYAQTGKNLKDAVREVVINFLEQNIDTAGPPVRVEEYGAEVCCEVDRPGIGFLRFMDILENCVGTDGRPGRTVETHYCTPDDAEEVLSEAREPTPETPDENGPVGGGEPLICCQDLSVFNPNDPLSFFWAERRWCEDKDDHNVVSPGRCPARQ